MQAGRLGNVAEVILAKEFCGDVVNEHTPVLEASEKDVFGFVGKTSLAGALGDGFGQGTEVVD